ncbi:MAG TPA: LuxR C-terminal-related transcriptional regulator [Streptosporangiaceae bacterium]
MDPNRPAGQQVTVSVIDDHPDLCYGVLARLPRASAMFVPGVMAATVPDFLDADGAAGQRSDVVLLDLTLKDGSAPAQNVAMLKNAGYPVVIYTGEERPERLRGTLGIGADALVRKEEAGLLEDALRAVVGGDEEWVSPLMAAIALDVPEPRLSPTQVEVLRLYATGVTAQQIASLLGCAVETVKSHLKAVKSRYEEHGELVRTRTDMLKVGLRDRYVAEDWYQAGEADG